MILYSHFWFKMVHEIHDISTIVCVLSTLAMMIHPFVLWFILKRLEKIVPQGSDLLNIREDDETGY